MWRPQSPTSPTPCRSSWAGNVWLCRDTYTVMMALAIICCACCTLPSAQGASRCPRRPQAGAPAAFVRHARPRADAQQAVQKGIMKGEGAFRIWRT